MAIVEVKVPQLSESAISAERPYRGAVPVPRTLEMMAETVGTAIDPLCFEALKQVLAREGSA